MAQSLCSLRWMPVAAAFLLTLIGCSRKDDSPVTPTDNAPTSPTDKARVESASGLFTEITRSTHLEFIHNAGFDSKNPEYYMPESMSAGAAMFDFDDDGDLDIYLINGARTFDVTEGTEPLRNRLFRNDGPAGFTDVTESSGLGDTGYGMGVAVGDMDNDGDEDVYITNVGPDALYRNNGDGTFTDVTGAAGIDNPRWAASVAFLDYDRDGYLDLFVTNYLAYDHSIKAHDRAGRPDYPGPHMYRGIDDVLFHNNGNGTFTDVTARAGLAGAPGRGLGVACADFNDDGLPDIYVANDREANRLWINRGDPGAPGFEDGALFAGVALNAFGLPEASMGVALGDIDGDADLDLFMTHLVVESNTLFINEGGGLFEDKTVRCGLSGPSVNYTGFGTGFLDYDHDGDLDLVVVNGRVRRDAAIAGAVVPDHWKRYAEPNLLFENDGQGLFRDISSRAGAMCTQIEVSRGLAVGDIDNDGDTDVLITNGGGAARLFRNDAPKSGHWLIVRVVDPALRRDANGAQVVVSAGGRKFRRDINRGFSYLCSGDVRAHFGLGQADRVESIVVRWLDGSVETFSETAADRIIQLSKGAGTGR